MSLISSNPCAVVVGSHLKLASFLVDKWRSCEIRLVATFLSVLTGSWQTEQIPGGVETIMPRPTVGFYGGGVFFLSKVPLWSPLPRDTASP